MSLLTAQHINKTFQDGEQEVCVLNDVSLSVKAGEHVAIVGSSGSGKSTLLHILGSLDTPTSGNINIDGHSIADNTDAQMASLRNQDIGFIYQFHHLLPEFSALENVAMPLLIGGMSDKVAREKARTILDEVGLSHRLAHFPAQLSGGERQRVAIARALVNTPKILLADEPTGNLDDATGEEIYSLIAKLKSRHGFAAVIVTHDLRLAAKLDTQYRLVQGHLSAGL